MSPRDHVIIGARPFDDSPFDAALARLEEAYALLEVVDLAVSDASGAFGELNTDIQSRALKGIGHLIAEAHHAAAEAHQGTMGLKRQLASEGGQQ